MSRRELFTEIALCAGIAICLLSTAAVIILIRGLK